LQSLEIINIDESPSFQKPRMSATISSRSNSTSSESSIKKPKSKKAKHREFSSSFSKKHSSGSSVKKRVDDLSRQLFPSHDYEELLKHAEELSSSAKAKTPKLAKTPSNPTSTIQQAPAPTVSTTKLKPTLHKSPVRDNSIPISAQTKKKEVIVTSTPIPTTDEENKKKSQKSTGKRRIDLRKLVSSTKPVATPASAEVRTSSIDDSFSSFASYNPDPPIAELQPSVSIADSPSDPSIESPAAKQTENVEINCPECSKPMSSAFALTCHMRRRHKVRAKKMFFPGQTVDTSLSSSSSISSNDKTAKKPSKNVIGPPEGQEACSETASFRSARNKLNASDSSDMDDDESKPLSSCYSADISSALNSDLSDTETQPRTKTTVSVPFSPFVMATVSVPTFPDVSDDDVCSDTDLPASRPINKFVNSTVVTARAEIEPSSSPAEIDWDSSNSIFGHTPDLVVKPISTNATSERNQVPITASSSTLSSQTKASARNCSVVEVLKSNKNRPCSENLETLDSSKQANPTENSAISELVESLITKVESSLGKLNKKRRSRKVERFSKFPPTSCIERKDGLYLCAMPNCSSRCKLAKSIRAHFQKKHYFEFLKLWGSKISPVADRADKTPTVNPVADTAEKTSTINPVADKIPSTLVVADIVDISGADITPTINPVTDVANKTPTSTPVVADIGDTSGADITPRIIANPENTNQEMPERFQQNRGKLF